MTAFAASPIAAKAIAHATVTDTWAGPIGAFLIPQKTRCQGKSVTVYRWLNDQGLLCDGLRCGHAADRMIAIARHSRQFADVRVVSELETA